MRIAITLVLIVMAAGAAGVLSLGRLVSDDDLRAQIVEQAEATSGRTVLIDGRMDIGLLPRPTLSVGATRFLANDPGTQPVLDVDRIDFGIAPLALLRGEVEVEEIRLVRPRFRLTDPDQPPVGLLQLLAARAGINLPHGLDRLSVIDGEMVIGAVAGSALIVERVDLEVEAESDRGPFFVHGTFVRGGEPFLLDGRLGRLTADPNTTASLELKTAPQAEEELALAFQGIVSLDRLSSFRGEASIAGSRLDAALGLLAPPDAVDRSLPLGIPFALDGLIDSGEGRGDVSNLRVRLGEVEAKGRLSYALAPARQVELELEVPRVDMANLGFEWRLLQAAAGLESIPHGEIDLSIAHLVHGDAALRDLRVTLDLEPGREVLVRQSRAVLPGETDLLFEGRLRTGERPGFEGRVSTVTDRFGDVLVWLDPGISSEAAARFRTLIVEAEVEVEPERVRLADLDGRLDGSKLHGDLALLFGDRTEVRADLSLDRLDLDRYLPEPEREATFGALLDRLRATDLQLELGLDRLNAAGLRWNDLRLAARAQGGRLDVEELRVGLLADTSLELTGAVDLAREEAALALAVRSAKPGPLIRRLGPSPAFSLERLGELEIDGAIEGWFGGARIETEATLGRLRSSARGSGSLDETGEVVLDLDVDLDHPRYPELLADLGLSSAGMADEPLAGAFKVRRQTSGKLGLVGHLGLGPSRVTGHLDYAASGSRPRIDARLSVAAPELDALLPLLALGGYRLDALAFARPLPGAWPSLYLDPAPLRALDGRIELSGKNETGQIGFEALLTSEAGLLRLERGRLDLGPDQGQLALQATLDVRDATPAAGLVLETQDLALNHLLSGSAPDRPITGRLDLYGDLRGTGWTFDDLVRSARGEATLSVRDGAFNLLPPEEGGDDAADPRGLDLLEAKLEVERGLGRVTRLDVQTDRGDFKGRGLVDLLIWMIDLDLEEQAGKRRIGIVGPPGDLQVLLRPPDAAPRAE